MAISLLFIIETTLNIKIFHYSLLVNKNTQLSERQPLFCRYWRFLEIIKKQTTIVPNFYDILILLKC